MCRIIYCFFKRRRADKIIFYNQWDRVGAGNMGAADQANLNAFKLGFGDGRPQWIPGGAGLVRG
ncbi:hypothetical protein GCM10022409_09990 [Hymenobacter glaciei]|uniref:Uncharacterized protein n=1 Tax=Hymenobacter glaciei TaxID=877209 RepID=A0ABP7TLA3_9BACT